MTPREKYIHDITEALDGKTEGVLTMKVDEMIDMMADSYELGFVEGQTDMTEKLVAAKTLLDAHG